MSAPRHPLPPEDWYVACAGVHLGEEPLAVELFDRRMVLLRTADSVAALEDRCPHRGVALSLGQASEDGVACAYHGWRFGADGRCRHIPSLVEGRRVPAGVAVRTWPCVEQDGYVWVWPGEGPPSRPAPLPIAGFAGEVWVQGRTLLDCEAILPIENNLDWCHPCFTHPETHGLWFEIGRRGFRDLVCELAVTDTGLEMSSAEAPGVRLAFELPDRVTVEAAGEGGGVRRIVIHHVPVGAARCRQEWLVSIGPAGHGRPHAVTWTDQPSRIFEQDRRVLESAQAAYEREGEGFERSVEADAATLLARRLIAAARVGRRGPQAVEPSRRQVRLRS